MNKKTNVLLILCDQLRPFELGCYGGEFVETPHINNLASSGTTFDIACSNNPVCTPARSCLISGQYGRTCTGSVQNAEEPVEFRRQFPNLTMAEVFGKEGYMTALIGKWHMDPNPRLMGFDETVYPSCNCFNADQTYFDGKGNSFFVEGFSPEFNLGKAREFMQEKGKSPFLLFYNITLPHPPYFDVPEIYKNYYDKQNIKLRPNTMINGKPAYDETWFKIYLYDFLYYMGTRPGLDSLPDNFDLKSLTAMYYGMITAVDHQIGQLLAMLKEFELVENTLVIFMSDHGDNLGCHKMFNKDRLWEESIRIPMIFSLPGKVMQKVNRRQIARTIDVLPTILELAGLEQFSQIQGQSLAPILTGNCEEMEENAAYIETPNFEIGIRTREFKLGMLISPEDHRVIDDDYCFYDLQNDPYEMNNMIGRDEYKEAIGRLKEQLKRWHENTPWMYRDATSIQKEKETIESFFKIFSQKQC